MRLKPIDPDDDVSLGDRAAGRPKHAPEGDELREAADKQTERIAELQKVFDHLRSVVGQGRGHEPRELQSSRSRTRYVHDRRMSSTRNARHGSGGNG